VGDFSATMDLSEAEEATFFSVVVNPIKCTLALNLSSTKLLDVKGLITHKFRLREFGNAVKTAVDPSKKPVKVVLN
jgi:threonine dehydrogenase-like Zn-dependent dehydrogenase